MTMLLWSGGLRASPGGDLRGRVLGKMENSCSPERKRDSPEPQAPSQGSVHCPAEREGHVPHGNISPLYPLRFYPDEESPKHWTKERHQFLMELKQEALTFARNWGADYILVRKSG